MVIIDEVAIKSNRHAMMSGLEEVRQIRENDYGGK
jgi:hypothetical protein